jgi:hypothetical protein
MPILGGQRFDHATRSPRSSIIEVHVGLKRHEVRTITLNQGQDLDWRLDDEGLYSRLDAGLNLERSERLRGNRRDMGDRSG